MSMIYAIVARGRENILASHTNFKGNFEQVAVDVIIIKTLRYWKNATCQKPLASTELRTTISIHIPRKDSSF